MSEILWVQEENILKSIQTNLFNVDRLHLVWPCSENTLEQNVNNLSRLVIYLTILFNVIKLMWGKLKAL